MQCCTCSYPDVKGCACELCTSWILKSLQKCRTVQRCLCVSIIHIQKFFLKHNSHNLPKTPCRNHLAGSCFILNVLILVLFQSILKLITDALFHQHCRHVSEYDLFKITKPNISHVMKSNGNVQCKFSFPHNCWQ